MESLGGLFITVHNSYWKKNVSDYAYIIMEGAKFVFSEQTHGFVVKNTFHKSLIYSNVV